MLKADLVKRVNTFWLPHQETAYSKLQSSIHDYRSRQVGSCAVSLLYIGCNNTWKLLALQKRIYSSIIFVAYNSTLFRAALFTLSGRSIVYQLFYSKRRCFEILIPCWSVLDFWKIKLEHQCRRTKFLAYKK